MTPDRPYGITAVRIISHRVAPRARAASMWSRGVCSKTSREIAVMIGRIMMASTTLATNTVPVDFRPGAKSGNQPRFS